MREHVLTDVRPVEDAPRLVRAYTGRTTVVLCDRHLAALPGRPTRTEPYDGPLPCRPCEIAKALRSPA